MINYIRVLNMAYIDIIKFITNEDVIIKAIQFLQTGVSVTIIGLSFYKNKIRKKSESIQKELKFDYKYYLLLRMFVFIAVLLTTIKVVTIGITPSFYLYTNLFFLYLYAEVMIYFDTRLHITTELSFEEAVDLVNRQNKILEGLSKENEELKEIIKSYENILKGDK